MSKNIENHVDELDLKLVEVDGKLRYTSESLTVLDNSLRKYLKKYRNPVLPHSNKLSYAAFHYVCIQHISHMIEITHNLLLQGDISKDSLGLLDNTVSSYGVHNNYFNKYGIPASLELIEKRKEKKCKSPVDSNTTSQKHEVVVHHNFSEVLTDNDVSRILQDDDKVLNIKTKRGTTWIFDKIKRTFSFKDKFGKFKTVALDKTKSWRETVSNFFKKMFNIVLNVVSYPYKKFITS